MTQFTASYFFVVACLCLLQFLDGFLFFVALIAMHAGIVAWIFIKKACKKNQIDYKRFYKRAYLAIGLFIPILLYKLVVLIINQQENETLKLIASIIAIALCIAVGLINLIDYLKKKNT